MSCEWGWGSRRAGARPRVPGVCAEGLGQWDASAPNSGGFGFKPGLRKDAGGTSFLLCVWGHFLGRGGQSVWGPASQGGCNGGKCRESLAEPLRHPSGRRGRRSEAVWMCVPGLCVYTGIGFLSSRHRGSWGRRDQWVCADAQQPLRGPFYAPRIEVGTSVAVDVWGWGAEWC